MTIYLDKEFKCHAEPADGLRAIETDSFDGKCKEYIEGCRFVPDGEEWVRDDGLIFEGEMVCPLTDYRELERHQATYVEAQLADVRLELEDTKAELAATREQMIEMTAIKETEIMK